MTARELTDWLAFERTQGPILIHERIDVLIARACYVIALSAGAKVKPGDFVVRWDQAPRSGSVQAGFERLLAMAEAKR